MAVNLSSDILLVLWSVATGCLLCFVYDIFRIIRLKFGLSKGFMLFLLDFSYCLFFAVCMLLLFFNLTYGKVRGYAFLFTAAGFALWRISAGRLITFALLWLSGLFSGIINSIKIRIIAVFRSVWGNINTKIYCGRLIKKSAAGMGLIKKKGITNGTNAKTDEG